MMLTRMGSRVVKEWEGKEPNDMHAHTLFSINNSFLHSFSALLLFLPKYFSPFFTFLNISFYISTSKYAFYLADIQHKCNGTK